MTRSVCRPGVIGPHALAVLRLAANGMTNEEIAARIGRSQETVKWHMSNVCRAFGARDRANAVAIGLRLGLLRLEEIRLPEAVSAAVRPVGRPVGPEARPTAARPSDRAPLSDLGAA